MKFQRQLVIDEVTLPPSAEWMDTSPGWWFIRVSQGAAYWLGTTGPKNLGPGDVIVIAPRAEGSLRASQLGEVKLHYFHFCPELLSGLLTLTERHWLESSAAQPRNTIRFLPATYEAARIFAEQVNDAAPGSGLLQRCQTLRLIALVFADELNRQSVPGAKSASARHRFKRLIQELEDNELISHPPEQLARLCGCSLRHFSRLFRQHFNVSIRSKQTELRLLKARQLLSESDAKIINVALDSGYRHLGLFNSMFKKYLGMTPTEWRAKNSKKPRPRKILRVASAVLLAAALLAWLTGPLCAADPPVTDTGETTAQRLLRIERELREREIRAGATNQVTTNSSPATPRRPAAGTNGPTFEVRGYEITGNTTLPLEVLNKIFAEYTGQMGFEEIRQALAELKLAYHGRGFVTVDVGLPRQTLTNGIVKVQVTEGKIAEINISGNRWSSTNNILRALPSLHTNVLLNNLVFQPELNRANLNRDRQIYPVIGPGPDPGTTALTLKVKDRLPLHGRFELNNFSTPNTPELRMTLAAQYNNLWQHDHQVGLQYTFTPEELKSETLMSRFYDLPAIASYSMFYRMPLPHDETRERRDIPLERFGYDESTQRFKAPPLAGSPELLFYASRSDTDLGVRLGDVKLITQTEVATFQSQTSGQDPSVNENLGVRFNYPLPDRGTVRSSLNFGVDFNRYRLSSLNTNTFFTTIVTTNNNQVEIIENSAAFGQPVVHNFVDYLPLSLGFDATRADKYGSTTFNLNNTFNLSGLLDGGAEFRRVAYSPKASGTYYIATLGLTRQQKLFGEWTLRLRADGQWANEPLLNNEQFGIGGNAGVRGYRDGAEYGDTGWRVLAEPSTPLLNVGMVDGTAPMYVRLSVFTDYGRRYLLEPQAGRSQALSQWGTGFAINSTIGRWFESRFTFGVPLLDIPGVKAGSPRVTFSVAAQF